MSSSIHPSLRLDRIQKLPLRLKRIATSAAQGSESDTLLLADVVREQPISDSQKMCLWAVFYAILDPARIPTPAALEVSACTLEILSVLHSLGVLVWLPVPDPSTYADIWARVWAWMNFLHTYVVHLQGLAATDLYLAFTSLICTIQDQWDGSLISTTPGVCVIVARAWVIFLDSNNGPGLENVDNFLTYGKGSCPASAMGEYFEGAGGTGDDLALTVVRYIKYALEDNEVSLANKEGISRLFAASSFIRRTTTLRGTASPYEAALIFHGLAGLLTMAICALNVRRSRDCQMTPPLLDQLFSLITDLCLLPPGYPHMREAIQAGLLLAIVSSATRDKASYYPHLEFYFTCLIPMCLVYHNVLVHMPRAMESVQKLVNAPAFQRCSLHPNWLLFKVVVDGRLKSLALFDSGNRIAFKACANMECDEFHDKHRFKRCSGCLDFYYCSRECQSIDWKAGHRQTCSTFRRIHMEEKLSRRDVAFLREIAYADFLHNRADVLSRMVTALPTNPSLKLTTSLAYVVGSETGTDTDMPINGDLRSWLLEEQSSTSGGKLALHRVLVSEGETTKERIFPMRFKTAEIPNALRAVAKLLPQGRNERQRVLAKSMPRIMDLEVVVAY
ncbi:hypothetical protein DFH06DRAFT_1467237 [Mycena polygramma]|nr:hypothetical protein DFH06DRAFT_1467237 [Mycena polygramma]